MNYLIVGRPNVGKSSVFNILIRKKSNIIHIDEGTTRDWHRGKVHLTSNSFVYDTPGIILNSIKKENNKIQSIIESIIPEINCFLFVIDFQSNLNVHDQIILKWLRVYNKKIILLINKKDNNKKITITDFYKFGIQDIFFLSCTHKLGFDKFRKYFNDNITYYNRKVKNPFEEDFDYSIAIFGKPNAGKSTFLNKLLGYERSLTSIQAGTTSDYVIGHFKYKSKKIRIYDTAGIGRKSKVSSKSIDYLAIRKSLKEINKVHSIILLIDSFKGLDRQDKRIIKLLTYKAKSLILVFNKIDLIEKKLEFKKNAVSELVANIHQLKNIKFFFISALSSKQVLKILDYVYKNNLLKQYNLNTSMINLWLKRCTGMKPHPMIDKKKVNFKYALKVKDYPMTVMIFSNKAEKINKNYIRYLKNNFNSYFKILNQNTKILFSKSQNPYQ